MARHPHTSSFSAHLMGMMLENRRRKRMICRYQRPAKCWRATMTSDTTTRAPKRIFVRQFTSRSNRPIWGTKENLSSAGATHGPPGEQSLTHVHLHPVTQRDPSTPAALAENTGHHRLEVTTKSTGPQRTLFPYCFNDLRRLRLGNIKADDRSVWWSCALHVLYHPTHWPGQ